MKYLDKEGTECLVRELKSKLKITRTEYTYTTASAETVSFTVPAYTTDGKSTLDIYINGLRAIPTTDYTMAGNKVTLTKELSANQTVYFVVDTISF